MNNSAMLVIDFINEIVDKEGKLASKGYADFIEQKGVFSKLNQAISFCRAAGVPVIFVTLAYEPSYVDQPKQSPVFGKANQFGILKKNEWSTAVHATVDIADTDVIIRKQRISAFHDTGLASMLRNMGVTRVFIAGVATDLAVESAARSAHDNDFEVNVIADACAAAIDADHEKSLAFLPKVATVMSAADLAVKLKA